MLLLHMYSSPEDFFSIETATAALGFIYVVSMRIIANGRKHKLQARKLCARHSAGWCIVALRQSDGAKCNWLHK